MPVKKPHKRRNRRRRLLLHNVQQKKTPTKVATGHVAAAKATTVGAGTVVPSKVPEVQVDSASAIILSLEEIKLIKQLRSDGKIGEA